MSLGVQRRFWQCTRAGSFANLRLATDVLQPPGVGEARVRIEAVGLNFADIFSVLGLYSATPRGTFTPGLEFAGVIEEIGGESASADDTQEAGVGSKRKRSTRGTRSSKRAKFEEGRTTTSEGVLAVGTRVMGVTRFGGYATHLNADLVRLRPIPEDWSFEQGAAFIAQALTAWYGLVELAALRDFIKEADGGAPVVLVHSAAGGVGLHALQICTTLGARVIATVGSESKVSFLLERCSLTREQVIVRTSGRAFGGQLDAALAAMGATGIDIVFDAVLGGYFDPAFSRLRPSGRYVVFGAASMTPSGGRPNWMKLAWQWLWRPKVDVLETISVNRSVMGFNLIWLWDKVAMLNRCMDDMLATVHWDPPQTTAFSFDRALDAMRRLQSGETTGKVVLVTKE